jgi:hypothetical protein
MKFVYQGPYIQIMGRMFAFGKPQEVNDPATISVLEKRSDFKKVEDEKEEKQETQTVLSDECPKCGKIVKRGKFMHQQHCKGLK